MASTCYNSFGFWFIARVAAESENRAEWNAGGLRGVEGTVIDFVTKKRVTSKLSARIDFHVHPSWLSKGLLSRMATTRLRIVNFESYRFRCLWISFWKLLKFDGCFPRFQNKTFSSRAWISWVARKHIARHLFAAGKVHKREGNWVYGIHDGSTSLRLPDLEIFS